MNYIALNENMFPMCYTVGFTGYELGKEYKTQNVVKDGFEFCKKIEDLSHMMNLKYARVFEVEVGDVVIECYQNILFATNRLKLVREVSKADIDDYFVKNKDRLVKSEDWTTRYDLADRGLCLEELRNDYDSYVAKKAREEIKKLNSGKEENYNGNPKKN